MSVPEACLYAVGNLLMAEGCTYRERDDERKARKARVVERKRAAMRQAWPEAVGSLQLVEESWRIFTIGRPMPRERALAFLIDLAFGNPFAPYQLKTDDAHIVETLGYIAWRLGLQSEDARRIWATRKDALKAHKHIAWGKVALFGVGGLAALALGGWLAAPVLAGWLGAGAGLAGAAATAHGLALLGGGSLAMGGWGMAGGLWLVTGVGGALGAGVAGGGALLVQIGAASAKVELLKLQVSYKEILLAGQADRAKAQTAIRRLEAEREEVVRRLAEEVELNDKNSARIEEIEETLKAIEDSVAWMKKQSA